MAVLTGLSRTEEAQKVNMEAVEFLLHMAVTKSMSLNKEEVSEVLRWIFDLDPKTSKLFDALLPHLTKAASQQKKEGKL